MGDQTRLDLERVALPGKAAVAGNTATPEELALIGSALARSLGLPETAARDRALRMLENSIAAFNQLA